MPYNVVAAEDKPLVRQIIEDMLDSFGHTIKGVGEKRGRAAQNGKEALEDFEDLARQGITPLILTDYAMPEMNGVQLIEAILDSCKVNGWSVPPIIMVSGGVDDIKVATAFAQKHGIRFLQKPVDIITLKAAIEEVAGGKATEIRSPSMSAER